MRAILLNTMMKAKDTKTQIDRIRLRVLTSAELFDAWRTIPRVLVAAYGYLCWVIVSWYMGLEPTLIEGCDIKALGDLCISQAPTTQHASLVTVMVGASAAVFGLYTNTGRSWSTGGFTRWDRSNVEETRLPPNRNSRQPMSDYRHNQFSNDKYRSTDNSFDESSRPPMDDEEFWD